MNNYPSNEKCACTPTNGKETIENYINRLRETQSDIKALVTVTRSFLFGENTEQAVNPSCPITSLEADMRNQILRAEEIISDLRYIVNGLKS